MVVLRRKKVTKYRGNSTHGGGARKKRRGAGSRGGRGRAGTGKRAGQKKASGLYQLGSHGFLPRRPTVNTVKGDVINVGYFTPQRLKSWVESGKARKEGDYYVIDLKKLGYRKLLGTGTVTVKLKLVVSSYSAQAAEKVAAAGGTVEGIVIA